MQMGFNNDVEYRGVTVHIQTEDLGLSVAKIMTQVFYSGAILEAKTISYADDLKAYPDPEQANERIRRLMRALHKQAYKRMQEGIYDAKLELLAKDKLKAAPERAANPAAKDKPEAAKSQATASPGTKQAAAPTSELKRAHRGVNSDNSGRLADDLAGRLPKD